MRELAKKYYTPEERDIVKGDDAIVIVNCFNKKCVKKSFYKIVKFESEVISCPHCGTKHKTRFYKNGKWSIRLADIK